MPHIIRKFKNFAHLIEALVANIYYGFPSKKIKVIGVTGTDGKTTTTHAIYHILQSVQKKTSMISTVYAKIAEREFETGLHTTTPGPFFIQKLLHQAVKARDEYFILETTSHAIDQNRVHGVQFDISVITNITHEHLDYHNTYEEYLKTKAKLLLRSKISLINRDDISFIKLQNILLQNKGKYFTFGLKNKADFNLDFKNELNFKITDFNNYNYLAAYAVSSIIGIDKEKIIQAMKTFILPEGRLDIVYNEDFEVIVDFAHTPNSFYNLLKDLREKMDSRRDKGKIIHVFGSAGLRDKNKRVLMGKKSSLFADLIILTEEDYRTEDPAIIAQEIARGFKESNFKFIDDDKLRSDNIKKYTVITDREKAIEKALSLAHKGDIVIITGKGHEKSLGRGSQEYPWDEKGIVNKHLTKMYDRQR